jgi:hypothetical protein
VGVSEEYLRCLCYPLVIGMYVIRHYIFGICFADIVVVEGGNPYSEGWGLITLTPTTLSDTKTIARLLAQQVCLKKKQTKKIIVNDEYQLYLKQYLTNQKLVRSNHRLSINRPTKREEEVSILLTLSMPKRDGRPLTGVSTIFDREPHSDPPC